MPWSETQKEKRQLQSRLRERVTNFDDRFVDFGVILRTVVADPNGTQYLPHAPKLRIIREQRFGGMLDRECVPPRITGPSINPVIWYCSEDTEPILLYDNPDKPKQLVHGSEGAGKTTVLVQYHYFRILDVIGEGREGGATAPINAKFDKFHLELKRLWKPSWYHLRKADNVYEIADGTTLRLLSTIEKSKQDGSRLSSYDWSWATLDEGQDQSESSHFDVLSRGRTAKDGIYPLLMTATNKDSYEWTEKRARMLASGQWVQQELKGRRSPFVHPNHWITAAGGMSERAAKLRIDADSDIPMERASYPSWSSKNLIKIPSSWEDITSAVLKPFGSNFRLLIGHDPGSMFDVSEMLKAFRVPNGKGGWKLKPSWVVVDELTTEETITEEHLAELLPLIRSDRYQLNLLNRQGRVTADTNQALVIADPYGESSTRPDKAVYTLFKNHQVAIRPAAYSKKVVAGHAPTAGQVPKEMGIEMVNSLICSADGERRFYVALKDDGTPVAPRLVKALMQSQKNEKGQYETEKKNKYDLSHWPATIRYALWQLERPKLASHLDLLQGGRN